MNHFLWNFLTFFFQTLILMADTNDHKKTLRDFIGMMEQLEAIINR